MNILKDNWSRKGNDLESLYEALDYITSITKVKEIEPEYVTIWVYSKNKANEEILVKLDKSTLETFNSNTYLHASCHLDAGYNCINEKTLSEIKKGCNFLISYGNDLFLVSKHAFTTLFQRAKIGGEATALTNNLARNVFFADAFIHGEKTKIVYREDEYCDKTIFAGLGKNYFYVQQTFLKEVIDTIEKEHLMGKTKMREWEMNHFYTDVHLEFPEAANEIAKCYKLTDRITPGVILSTSDTGDCSVTAQAVIRTKRGYSILHEISKQHKKSFSAKDFLESVDTEIFGTYRKLPECLSRLLGIPVIDYDKTDLSTESGASKNREAVSELIKKVLNSSLFTQGNVLSKAHRKNLIDCLCAEIDPSIHYSWYDVAYMFLGLGDRIVLERANINKVRTATGQVPYFLENMSKKSKVEEEKLYLIPA